ncbi:MAG: transcriptional repressor [Planctomycetes bacterium]|jgi:Fur family peroxide stress response transcriptional regulator|nr:transcriptional repressor [Planctomycetota bacterium]
MRQKPADLDLLLAKFREACRKAGVRMTPQRLGIYRAVASTCEHPDAEAVFLRVRDAMPDVSLDTVYRTLHTFVDLGLVDTLGTPREKTRFDADTRHHHHFVCTVCGSVFDFECEVLEAVGVPSAARAFGEVERAVVEFRGSCCRCSGKRPPRAKDRGNGKSAPRRR